MNRYVLIATAALAFAACKNNDTASKQTDTKLEAGKITVNGELTGLDTGIVEVFVSTEEKKTGDTVQVKGGKFTFEKDLAEPAQIAIRIPGMQAQPLSFFADPGEVTIKGSKDSLSVATVKAGATQELFKQSSDSVKVIMTKGEALYQQYIEAQSKQDAVAMKQIEDEFTGLQKKATEFSKGFAIRNRGSVIAPYLALVHLTEDENAGALKSLYDTLTPAVKASFFGKKIGDMVKAAENTAVGAMAIDFTQPDVNGKPVSLSSYKGKYVLVDFWASWCGPCRQENPNVVKAYNAYKAKGFDILGVSLDEKKEDWLKAIDKDKLTWTHVSDLKGWQNEAAAKYGVQAIPANYLLDKEGKIIGKNLRGEALEAKLAEVLK